ncbi:MAG TPA: hypothetical protein VL128_11480 [Candidatus Eisenbacteria bacterium]|nr:hypothetical protein [Candidatus Eisenbacteria bacterium]
MLRHIAVTERYLWGENPHGKSSRYKDHGEEFTDGLKNILSLMERLHAESLEMFSSLNDADLRTKCRTPGDVEVTKWKWLRQMA